MLSIKHVDSYCNIFDNCHFLNGWLKMRNKIRILMSLVESFEKSMALGVHSKETIMDAIIPHFAKTALDKAWYANISKSFISDINNGKNVRDWLADQFKEFGIYQASEKFQGMEISNHHCMSFIFDFLNMKQDLYFCDLNSPFHYRAESFLEENEAREIKEENLKVGNLILYKNQTGYIHIALSIGLMNGQSYAISKFGEAHNVFMHPIDCVPENYGTPIYFDSKLTLNSDLTTKFEIMKNEVQKNLKNAGTKLDSGLIRLWSVKDLSTSQKDEFKPNVGFRI